MALSLAKTAQRSMELQRLGAKEKVEQILQEVVILRGNHMDHPYGFVWKWIYLPNDQFNGENDNNPLESGLP